MNNIVDTLKSHPEFFEFAFFFGVVLLIVSHKINLENMMS